MNSSPPCHRAINVIIFRNRQLAFIGAVIAVLSADVAISQTLQYRSPNGVEYKSLPDAGQIARAKAAHLANKSDDRQTLALASLQVAAREHLSAAETYGELVVLHPRQASNYAGQAANFLRAHQLERARVSAQACLKIDSSNYSCLYTLGIIHMVRGEIEIASQIFQKTAPIAPDANEFAGASNWLWISLKRQRHDESAAAVLKKPPLGRATAPTYGYTRLLSMYRGDITPNALVAATEDVDAVQSTVHNGIGNWYLTRGDTTNARAEFQKSVEAGGWQSWGFMISEGELARLKK